MEPELADLTVREYLPGDEQAILESFNRIFPLVDRTFRPRSMEEWRWRFEQNPAGWRIWLAKTADGRVVAHQAGMPIAMVHQGERVRWNQIVDSFADPRFGRGLKKPGVFVLAAQPFSDIYGGPPPKDQIMYGLPVRRAYRIGQRFLKYQTVRDQHEVRGDVERVRIDAAPGIEVEEVDAFPDEVDAFFERASRPLRAVAVRDRAFLSWRFERHPTKAYRIALARAAGSGELVGYAVTRKDSFDLRESGLVCDWLLDPERREAGHALRAWLVERARAEGVPDVRGIFPEPCAEFREFQQAGFRVHPTSYFLAAGSYYRSFHTLGLYWDWYYTLAEFDLA